MSDAVQASSELVTFIARGLVEDKDAVRVNYIEDDALLELLTADADRGRVIGRQGRIAKAMRAVLAASRAGARLRLDIVG